METETEIDQTGSNAPKQSINKRREHPKRTIKIGKNVDDWELKRMPIVIRSKFAYYLEPPNAILEAQKDSKKRLKELIRNELLERKKEMEKMQESISYNLPIKANEKNLKKALEEADKFAKFEKERHERLIGQLKAAEAANRTRILKLRYHNLKKDEVDNLIESQSSALNAVRLEAFLPSVEKQVKLVEKSSNMSQIERRRLEALVDDDKNRFIARKLD